MAEIYSLVYKSSDDDPPHNYNRTRAVGVNLIAGHGIEGDLKAGKHPDRQLNIMSYETLGGLNKDGFKTQPGELGEQIIVRGVDVNALAAGTRLQFGGSVVVEVVKQRTGCDRFEAIQGKPRTDAAARLGVLARVITGGIVRVSDPVIVLQTITE